MQREEKRWNGEHYNDPTADRAIARADREIREKKKREELMKKKKKINKNIVKAILILVIPMVCHITIEARENKTLVKDEHVRIVERISDQYDICPELVIAVIESESGGDPSCQSDYGAIGLMQVVPRYNRDRMKRLGVSNLYDPEQNIRCGVDLLVELFEKYDDPACVLMYYNMGHRGLKMYEQGKISRYAQKILNRSYELERIREDIE